MKYQFTDDFLTGIDFIDAEHRRLFEIANDTHDLLKNDLVLDKFDKIVALIEELKEYTKTHFAHEEAYMEEMNFQHRFSECHQHMRFIAYLESIDLRDIDAAQEQKIEEILDFLARWLTGHIKGADVRIGRAAGTLPEKA